MKKVTVLLFAFILTLVSCGNDELSDFVESYNEHAHDYVSVELLKEDNFEDIREDKYGNWRLLHEREDYYYIEAKYSKENELTGYHIHITGEEAYEDHEGEGYEAALTIAKTLGVDVDEFIKQYDKALVENSDTIEFDAAGYEISISNFNVGQMIINEGMTINFNKTSE